MVKSWMKMIGLAVVMLYIGWGLIFKGLPSAMFLVADHPVVFSITVIILVIMGVLSVVGALIVFWGLFSTYLKRRLIMGVVQLFVLTKTWLKKDGL